MTKSPPNPDRSALVVAKRLWHGNAYHAEGTPWDSIDTEAAPVDDARVQHYLDTGYLQDRDALEQARNAEAFAARQESASKDEQIQTLTAELEALRGQGAGAPDLSAVTALLPDVKTVADLPGAITALQGQVKTLQAVHASEGGSKLPSNFKKVGALTKIGLGTWESLQGKSWQQLTAVEGVTDEDARDIAQKVEAHFAQPE